MLNKSVLITGSTDGIGQQCATELAAMGATVILHGRNASRGKALVEHIRRESRNERVDLFIADLSSLKQVRRLADDVLTKYPHLDILVNNAGVYMHDRQVSEDGYEMTFAVNHLAHFLLTNLLLDGLKKQAPSKIIVVSSIAHQNARFDFANLQGEKRYDAYAAYSLSKLDNLLFTYELAERLKGSPVTVNALHPGVIATKLLRAGFGSLGGSPVTEGSQRILHLINSPSTEEVTGKYFVNDSEQSSSPDSRDRKIQKEFWAFSEKLVGLSQNR